MSEEQALQKYKKRHIDKQNWYIKISPTTCCKQNTTVLHPLPQGTRFRIVDTQNFNTNNEFLPKPGTFVKLNYSPVDHTYLCLDENNKKHYIASDTWCIVINNNYVTNDKDVAPPHCTHETQKNNIVKKDITIKHDNIERVEIYKEPSFDYVMIKTTEEMMMNDRGGSLYESTRKYWRASSKITSYTYVICVIDQIVQRVYIAERWHLYMPGEDGCPTTSKRWGFEGKEAHGEEFDKLIGKRIPEKYRVPGNASPVLYKKS